MEPIFLLDGERQLTATQVGGKAVALATLLKEGVRLPKTACLTTAAYRQFLHINGLSEKIQLELNTKEFSDMRWEEIWDISLRIRQLFLTTRLPTPLAATIHRFIAAEFGDVPLAVRSSATEEDAANASFAGLHDSYLNIRSREQLERAIRKVWASLWSDKALLYRQELQLSVGASAMAVVIQELLPATVSGVGFTHDPLDQHRMVIEAVHGLNQGLVDGDVQPDRYRLKREDHDLIDHLGPEARDRYAISSLEQGEGIEIASLPPEKASQEPLDRQKLATLVQTMARLEARFATPLDIEWCWAHDELHILQARPITAAAGERTDRRAWYLSLHRSFENLLSLWQTIEQQMLPAMEGEFEVMAAVVLTDLADQELAAAIRHRSARLSHWSKQYWDDCIPFAHGVRLFGEIFNEVMTPADPYQFVSLLSGEEMLSTRRNSMLHSLADQVRSRPEIGRQYTAGGFATIEDAGFCRGLLELEHQFGNFFRTQQAESEDSRDNLMKVILQYARLERTGEKQHQPARLELEHQFLTSLSESPLNMDGGQLLALARASYRLRDDDNVYMGKIEQQLALAVAEGRRRLVAAGYAKLKLATPEELAALLVGEQVELPEQLRQRAKSGPERERGGSPRTGQPAVRARQLPGQPASRGFCRATARVIEQPEQMAEFKAGEVLVVDSIDPNMTFLAPLAAGIVERRGGMLIHGAIIAREYGIPCVTGVSGVTGYIRTGDLVSVDGYLGLVIVEGGGASAAGTA